MTISDLANTHYLYLPPLSPKDFIGGFEGSVHSLYLFYYSHWHHYIIRPESEGQQEIFLELVRWYLYIPDLNGQIAEILKEMS